MKIGVLGGTFDPIHRAHLAIAECALREYGLDEVWFMPAGDPYFKEGSPVTEPKLRLAMTRTCIEAYGEPRFRCSDFEIRDRERTYTAETFRKLHALYPEDLFYLIMGLDSLEALSKWYRPELLLQNAVILCALRAKTRSANETFSKTDAARQSEDSEEEALTPADAKEGTGSAVTAKGEELRDARASHGCGALSDVEEGTKAFEASEEDALRFLDAVRLLQEEYGSVHPDIRQLHCPEMNISSTMIREAVRGGDLASFVTPAVAEFIEKHGLYR